MTTERDVERLLERWLVDGVDEMPDRVYRSILDRVDRQPQQRAWRLRPWRFPTMSTPIRIAALAAVLVASLFGGSLLLSGGGGVGPPTPTPTPTPSPSPTRAPSPTPIACEDQLPGCAGHLMAGTHTSKAFQPKLTYSSGIGIGSNNVVDTPSIFKLDPSSPVNPYLILWSNVAIPTGCDAVKKPGTGSKISDFVAYLTNHPGVDVLSSVPVTVGGWQGKALDLRIKDTYTEGCPGIPGFTVQFILDTDPVAGAQIYGVNSLSRMHVVFVDVNGRTVIIQAYLPDSDSGAAAALEQSVQPLIDSFQFAPGG